MPSPRQPALATNATSRVGLITFWASAGLLALVPLAFSTIVHRSFTLPKVTVLLVGSAAIVALLGLMTLPRERRRLRLLRSPQVRIACLYVGMAAVSTAFGVAPRVALFGSFENQMGLMTRLCFLTCFLGIIVGIGHARARLRQTLWVILITGLVVATYGFAQFFGRDPFFPTSLYTFDSSAGRIVRVISTLGHADYLGNFLLYTTPVSAAVAFTRRGRARLLAWVATLLSVAVIVFSGTRGAVVGLAVGALAFALVVLRRRVVFLAWRDRQTRRRAAFAALVIIAAVILIAVNPASRNIVARARAAAAEGASGSGRTRLWRDSLAMVPAYALAGCGPEGFRSAFLPYKSKALAQLAPQTNNENPHNAYLDAAISEGLPGAILYVALLASSLILLLRAGRRADGEMKMTSAGILSALAAVAAHNLFIFDQIPTGLYFFAFAALAQAAFNVATGERRQDEVASAAAGSTTPSPLGRVLAFAGFAVVVAALWYALALVRADLEMRRSFVAADAGDFDGAAAAGRRAAGGAEPTGAYQFELARSLALYADVARARLNRANLTQAEAARLTATRATAISEATAAARASLAHSLTPDSSYLLLAYLAWLSGDPAATREAATAALRLDPYFANGHWLMAESWMMEGDAARARQEAEVALEINPYSREARDVFKRARGDDDEAQQSVEGLIAQARDYESRGQLRKARRRLLRALQRSGDHCLACHRELAQVYETQGQTERAIAEWQAVAAQASDPATIQQSQSRIAALRQKAAAQ